MKSLHRITVARWAVCLASIVLLAAAPAMAGAYKVTKLTADQAGMAPFTDPNLVNPWGVSFSSSGFFWVSDNGTGLTTLYDGSGSPQSLVVTIPSADGTSTGTPTGQVFNGTTDFKISGASTFFLFVTQDGTISGWTGGASALIGSDNSASGAVYLGMELANNGSGNFLYVANFAGGTVDVFDANYQKVSLAGSFVDPTLPSGYAPFNLRALGGNMIVLYAKQGSEPGEEEHCAGCGFVSEFDLNGNFIKRLATRGKLNAPWGVALAPANFGTFSNDLLVGNFGDGKINVYDPNTGAFLGQLKNSAAQAIRIPGLWALTFGNGGSAGKTNELFFTAGPVDETHGFFGKVTAQ